MTHSKPVPDHSNPKCFLKLPKIIKTNDFIPNWDPKVLSVKGYQSEPWLYASDVTNSKVKSQKPYPLGTLLPIKYQPPVSVFLDETCYSLVQNG